MKQILFAVRTLRLSPGYTAACVVLLALGIGVNTAVFSVLHAVVLRPLPYPDPDRLVFVWEHIPNMPDPPGGRIQVSRRNWLEWKRQNTVFAEMAAYLEDWQTETGGSENRRVKALRASAELFGLLGATPRLGRLFTTDEEQRRERLAVLSDGYFKDRFQRDPRAVGSTLTLGGEVYTIVGVLPPKFFLPATWEGMNQLKPELYIPLAGRYRKPEDELRKELLVPARMKPGATLEQARREMAAIAARVEEGPWSTNVFPFSVEDSPPEVRRGVLALFATVAGLLLIACANLANLTLARAALRSREVAVRLALGATRGSVAGLLLAEALLVSLAGAALGLLLADWTVKLLIALKPEDMLPRSDIIGINGPVVLFATAVAVLTAALFGLGPALAAARANLNLTLRSGGWGVAASRTRSRQALIAVEAALALMLLSGAGLLLRSFHAVTTLGVGFDTAHLIAMDVDLPENRYKETARPLFYRNLLDRLRTTPGVAAASIVEHLPMHSVSIANFYIAGKPEPPVNALPLADYSRISPDYFDALRLRLEAGRTFTETDLLTAAKGGPEQVAIVNRAFAQKFFPAEETLGRRILTADRKQTSTIVGIVADYRPLGAERGSRPQIFWANLGMKSASVLVRTTGPPAAIGAALREAVRGVDKELAASQIKTLDDYAGFWTAPRKFHTLVMAIFAGLGLVLAATGIYGVLSNLVASRVREIGIRMAVGAGPGEIARLVLRQTMAPVSIGIAAGLAGSLAAGRYIESLLYGVKAYDPAALAMAVGVILLVAPLAAWIPLRRALRVDCTVALREE